MIDRRRFLFGAVPAALLVEGCGGPPPPAVVDVTIRASSDINPNPAGTPVSVAVRLYSLNARGKFESADVYSLMQREAQTLGTESAGAEEVVVRPGETRKVTLMPKPGVRFIGVAVLFRDIDRAQWRMVTPIAESGLSRFAISISGTRAALVPT
ncbi:type VI secretion system lipoprotein TssJ [Reyranella soli]|uniref:Type VI secretion system-associated lipoprotein n=1 Tax=Reyranella soli TaxID=1230389 RepID=A0A512NB66_9HYPH|nr:type VI secretion system lipoprotein TssJ [Reyranella soli]GEP56189.1 type VI secretion system-associated lipoprotein [Reyranella soli]